MLKLINDSVAKKIIKIYNIIVTDIILWLGLATWNFDFSLRLMSYLFVPNFEAVGHMTLVLQLENRLACLTCKAV